MALVSLAGCVAIPIPFDFSDPLTVDDGSGTRDVTYDEAEFALLVNDERGQAQVQPVTFNAQLTEAAEFRAQDMVANNYFSHYAPDGTTAADVVAATGYEASWLAENLLMGTTDESTAVDAWMSSPSHAANIVAPEAQEIGLGLEADIYVLILAAPAD